MINACVERYRVVGAGITRDACVGAVIKGGNIVTSLAILCAFDAFVV